MNPSKMLPTALAFRLLTTSFPALLLLTHKRTIKLIPLSRKDCSRTNFSYPFNSPISLHQIRFSQYPGDRLMTMIISKYCTSAQNISKAKVLNVRYLIVGTSKPSPLAEHVYLHTPPYQTQMRREKNHTNKKKYPPLPYGFTQYSSLGKSWRGKNGSLVLEASEIQDHLCAAKDLLNNQWHLKYRSFLHPSKAAQQSELQDENPKLLMKHFVTHECKDRIIKTYA